MILEAMAASLPIVATAVGGVPEIVENNESALLVPANDPPAMAAAIVRLLTDRNLAERLTNNSTALIANQFTPEKYVRALFEIYSSVINARQNRLTLD